MISKKPSWKYLAKRVFIIVVQVYEVGPLITNVSNTLSLRLFFTVYFIVQEQLAPMLLGRSNCELPPEAVVEKLIHVLEQDVGVDVTLDVADAKLPLVQ